jgi:hypothetical protein
MNKSNTPSLEYDFIRNKVRQSPNYTKQSENDMNNIIIQYDRLLRARNTIDFGDDI